MNKKHHNMGVKIRTIIGSSRYGDYFEYRVGNKEYWVQGELYFNESKGRYEHEHEGPRGGRYLIVWYR